MVTLAPENILNVQVVDEEGNLVEGTSLSLTNASGEVVAKWEDGGSVEAYNNSEIEKAGEFMEPFTSLEYLVTPYEIQNIRNIAENTSYGGSTFLVESGTSDYEITYKEAMETALTVPAKTLVIIVDDSWGQRSETGRIEFYNTEDYVFPLDSSTVGKNEYSLADLDAGEYRLWYFFCNIGRTPASPTFSCTDEPVEYVKMQVKLSEVSEYFTEDGLFTENGRTYSLSQEGSDQNAAVVFFSGSVVQAVVPNSEGIVELYVDKNTRKMALK